MINWFKSKIPKKTEIFENRWLSWLHPLLYRRYLWAWSRRGVSLGVALGVFFGFLIPVGQIPFSVATAVLLRANVPVAIASTFISNPFTYAPIYVAAYQTGSWVLNIVKVTSPSYDKMLSGESLVNQYSDSHLPKKWWEQLDKLIIPTLMGFAVLAIIGSLSCYFLLNICWYWRVKWLRRQPRKKRKSNIPPPS